MTLNGFKITATVIKDTVIIIIFIISAAGFIFRGENHIQNDEIHLANQEKVLVENMVTENWKSNVDKELALRDTKVEKIVKETIKELKEQGYLK